MKSTNPTSPTEAQRFDEIAEVLARGIQRFLANEIKRNRQAKNSSVRLDAHAHVEAPCGSRILGLKSQEPAA